MTTKKVKAPVSQDAFEAELQSIPQLFDGLTLGITFKAGGGYNIVTVAVDSKGLEAGELKVIDTAENRSEAVEKFKINAVRLKVI